MLRKTFFIAVLVGLLFLLYRGINPSGADKLINKISSLREKNPAIVSQTGNINTGNLAYSGSNASGDLAYERILQSGTMIELTGKNETSNFTGTIGTGAQTSTGTQINTGNKTSTGSKTTVKTTAKTNTTIKPTPTNTNGLSAQDMIDLKNLLNNIVE